MKLIDSMLLSAAVGFLMIGVHRIFVDGKNSFYNNYWIFMLMLLCLYVFSWRRKKREEQNNIKNKNQPININQPKSTLKTTLKTIKKKK
jgi:Ca2+/Na+ antiporter